MKNKLLLGVLLATLVIGSLLAACAAPSPAPTSAAPAPTATPPAPAPELMKLKYSSPFQAVWDPGKFGDFFMDYIEQKTNGKIVFERFPGGQLADWPEQLALAQNNLVDVMVFMHLLPPDQTALHNVMPAVVASDMLGALDYAYKIEFEVPETSAILQKEWATNNLKLMAYSAGTENYIVSTKQFKSLADLKGRKNGNDFAIWTRTWPKLGVTAVNVGIPDTYEGLSRGLIDMHTNAISGLAENKMYEVVKCIAGMKLTPYSAPLVVNLKTWQKLSPDMQKLFTEAAQAAQKASTDIAKTSADNAIKAFRDKGVTFTELSAADLKLLAETAMSVSQEDAFAFAASQGKSKEAELIWKYSKELMGIK